MGSKVPKSSARRFPRDCASHGAARGAQDQAYAPPRGGRAAARTLFFRVKRECGITVPPQAAVEYLYGMRSGTLFSRKVIPDLVRWRKSGRRLKARAAGTVCLQTRAVARRRFQTFGRRHRNRSGGFCCFSPSKSREKSFPELYAESSRGFRKVAVLTNFFLLVLLGPKVPKASARRFPRDCAIRGAARGAQDQAYAPPRGGRAAARTLFFRVKRECGLIVPPTAALIIYIWQCAPAFFLPARRFPTWFRWRKSGRRTESESGGDGLLANPRSRPTPLSAFRPPASESVGWLLLLFAIEKQVKKKKFSARRPKIAKGFRENFCCFSLLKSSKIKKWRGADNR